MIKKIKKDRPKPQFIQELLPQPMKQTVIQQQQSQPSEVVQQVNHMVQVNTSQGIQKSEEDRIKQMQVYRQQKIRIRWKSKLNPNESKTKGSQKNPYIDYNPQMCKDYYVAGKCTFGNSCIYIHDRSQYKSSWQLEEQYKQKLKRKDKLKQDQPDGPEDQQEQAKDKYYSRRYQLEALKKKNLSPCM